MKTIFSAMSVCVISVVVNTQIDVHNFFTFNYVIILLLKCIEINTLMEMFRLTFQLMTRLLSLL